MAHTTVEFPPHKITEFCRSHQIRRLALFGSVLTEKFRPDSDVDVLVEFESGHTPSLLGMAGLEMELSEMLGRKVDLRTPSELSPYIREQVVAGSKVLHAAG